MIVQGLLNSQGAKDQYRANYSGYREHDLGGFLMAKNSVLRIAHHRIW